MHVSQKYLDLTKQKLELVRLPRDPRNVQRGWEFGVSKSQLEPLIGKSRLQFDITIVLANLLIRSLVGRVQLARSRNIVQR